MKKIAIPVTEDNLIEDHFGQCAFYGVYTISDKNEILEVQSIKSEQGCGCKSTIANDLATIGVRLMLAGGIGAGAINVLQNSGIEVINGCSGKVEDILEQYFNDQLTASGKSCSQHEHHHSHGHQHSCHH